MSSKR